MGRSSYASTTGEDSLVGSSTAVMTATGAVKKASDMAQVKDAPDTTKLEDSHIDRSVGVKKPKSSGDEGPSLMELSGFNPKRQEFDPEYDNDAEKSLADMEFKDTDTEAERELKLRILHIYSRRLDERKRRKDFILERDLFRPNLLIKGFSPEERILYQRYDVFMRFHSKEKHEKMMKAIIEEHRIRKQFKYLLEAREAGCHTSSEAERYIEQKKKREAEESAHKAKENNHVGLNGKVLQRVNRLKEPDASPCGGVTGSNGLESSGGDTCSSAGWTSVSSLYNWDVTGLPGAELLSEKEQRLCNEMKILPSMYLRMQEVISMEIFKGNITEKSDAHLYFNVDPSKVDRVYDVLVRKGIVVP